MNDDEMSEKKCFCTECGFDCTIVRKGNAKFCPQCGTAILSHQSPTNEMVKEPDTDKALLCPDCQLDCTNIPPTNGRIDCPRCGTSVKPFSNNTSNINRATSEPRYNKPPLTVGKPESKFNRVYATNAAAFMMMIGISKMFGGDPDAGSAILLIFAPILFGIGGVIGWGKGAEFGIKSRTYWVILAIWTVLSVIGQNVIMSAVENYDSGKY